jgi:hypothetical protein
LVNCVLGLAVSPEGEFLSKTQYVVLSAFAKMERVLVHAADMQNMWLCVTVTEYQLKSTLHLIFKRIIRGIWEKGHRQEIFSPPKTSTPASGQPSLLLNGYRNSGTGVKGQGCEVYHSPSPSAEVKNVTSCKSTPSGVDRDNFVSFTLDG